MEIPKSDINKVTLIRADDATGIILNNDSTYYQSTGDNYYRTFNSLQDAKHYINAEVSRSSFKCEYLLYDHIVSCQD